MTDYYYAQGKHHLGPFTLKELRQKDLKPDTYIWWPTSPDWKKAQDVPELQDLFWNQPPPTPKKRPISTSQQRSGSNPGNGYPPKSWLIESILVTLFCCQVFGIVAIVYAAQVESKFKQGDILGAEFASRKARFWVYLSFWLVAGAFMLIACFAILMNLLGHTQ